MADCKLCKAREADKTGSHYVPHFLLKRIDNYDGSKDRDKELGFIIDSSDTKRYIGRRVSQEKLEEVFGELSEEEIEQLKQNPSVENNVFCIPCEDRFSQIESEYAKTLEKFDVNHEYKSNIEGGAAFLFWASILWRISISKKYNLELDADKEETLRELLNIYLQPKFSNINFVALIADPKYLQLAYRLIRSPNYSNGNATVLVGDPVDTRPYTLLVDEFILFFYFDIGDISNPKQAFFGIEEFCQIPTPNVVNNGEYVFPIKHSIFHSFMDKVFEKMAQQRHDRQMWIFDESHKSLSGKNEPMPVEMKEEIMAKIMDEEKKIGRKHTEDDMINSMYEVMKKYSS